MAISTHNILTAGLRGRVGNLIYRSWCEMTIVSAVPSYRNRKWSKAQQENRLRFRAAMAWAKSVMKDPERRGYYTRKAKGIQTPWNAAVADYMKKPLIGEVDISGYKGKKGNTIRVKATDNYRVMAVVVTILSSQGVQIESGTAVLMSGTSWWTYKSRENNPLVEGTKVVVRVSDSPGNVTQHSCVVQRK